MPNATLAGKKVTVMGLGLHGGALGTIEWLYAQRAVITVTDLKTAEELESSVKKIEKFKGINLVLGRHREIDFTSADLIIRNPGAPASSPYLELARKHNIPVEMDSGLFFQYCQSKNIIGITGSKGKSTTTNVIAHVLSQGLSNVVPVGIDGISPLKSLENITSESTVVFELSSWRLEALNEKRLSPGVAVVTSIYKDHLNTYPSYEDYIEIKKTIFKYQKAGDAVLLNADDPIILSWEKEIPSTAYWFSMSELPEDKEGIFIHNNFITLRATEYGRLAAACLGPVESIPYAAIHERRNVLPALFLGYLRGMNFDMLRKSLTTIQPLKHRMELVRVFQGISFINDSAATMPDATIAALNAFKGRPIVHILGGSDKALEFEDLALTIKESNIRALIFLPGTATERMKKIISSHISSDTLVLEAASMEDAVKKSLEVSRVGDIVLLSPGATSFGLFKHEFDRGDKFREAAATLKET